MRDTRIDFFEKLTELAREDEKVIFLTGDLGYPFCLPFFEEFPDRAINCGIQEQNMVGVAAGLARTGWEPFVYSGAMFLCTRALEQIRDDICYPDLNVKLVGTGASGFLGYTHNFGEKEDWKDYLKGLPNLTLREGPNWDIYMHSPQFIKL